MPLFHGLSCKAFAQQCTLPASLGIEQQQCGESLHALYLLLTHDAGGKKKVDQACSLHSLVIQYTEYAA